MTRTVIDALGAFFSTTLDDLLVLVYLFLEKSVDPSIQYPYARIVFGQFLGFSVIVLISLVGLLLETEIPIKYIDLIGLIPFIFGSYKLYEAVNEDYFDKDDKPDDDAEKVPILPNPNMSNEKDAFRHDDPIPTESRTLMYQDEDDAMESQDRDRIIVDNSSEEVVKEEPESNFLVKILMPLLKLVLDPLILESTILSLMCGSDNIVIYTSLFASESVNKVVVIISVFYGLLLFNAGIALIIVKAPPVIALFDSYSKYVISILLMALGLDILSSSIIWP